MAENLDLRIIKTRRLLIDALFELLKNRLTNHSLKVLDICKKANVTSMTFYSHFKNKVKLLEYAIKDQLENKFPIPIKLKPHNMKQLIIYLINFMSNFCIQNKVLITNCYVTGNKYGFENTYLDLFLKTIQNYTFQELRFIYKNETNIVLNMWTEMITGALFNLFISRTIKNRLIENNNVFNYTIKMFNSFCYNG